MTFLEILFNVNINFYRHLPRALVILHLFILSRRSSFFLQSLRKIENKVLPFTFARFLNFNVFFSLLVSRKIEKEILLLETFHAT